ncbi:hypothetical protein ACQVP2_09975 [Methylobacterium aquaticum]|uniref:Uncharacterized protein n=1 Tax=Methylobacterium aquaticum TaxID=270351 RepID=A0A0J6UX71_9HYPH|nr:hypothetical protein [Methylobacterium aquaticum]KMO30911.1 hypothetical protein VP06_20505 [Methylobacterium aquaticum]
MAYETGTAATDAVKTPDKTPDKTPELCIIDLGQQDRARIRKLRQGQGKLTRQVLQATEALQEEGVLAADAQIVVVLVRETPSLKGLLDNLRDDDDDDDDD